MDLERIEAILKLLQRQQHVGALSVEGDGWRVKARRGAYVPLMPILTEADSEAPEPADSQTTVTAGVVGTFRTAGRAPKPGDFLSAGASLGSIDSMRILSPVLTEEEGYLVDVRVEDGDPVEYGQELFVLSAVAPEETAL